MYEAKVKYTTIDQESGKEKKFNVAFIVDAMSYTECESRLIKELTKFTYNYIISPIKLSNYTDLFLGNDGDKYYRAKLQFISVDESAGKEKKVSNNVLIVADSLEQAKEYLNVEISKMVVDCDVTSISETNIMDVFLYQK